SGSPVVGPDGRVVALNAGGSWRSSSSYYLPLDRVVRAIDLIEQGLPVTRGTIGTVFLYTPFGELGRLGLTETVEQEVRTARPAETGMLVVNQVIPGCAADGLLEPGDILLQVNGRLVTRFVPLEEVLDDSVGQTVTFSVQRGGETLEVPVTVSDLHAVTPDQYLEVGGSSLNEVSFQQARNHHIAPHGVYLARSGYAFSNAGIPTGSLLVSADDRPLRSLEDAWEVFSHVAQGQRITIRYAPINRPSWERVAVVDMDRRWFDLTLCTRDDETGLWPCLQPPEVAESIDLEPSTTTFVSGGPGPLTALAPSIVTVTFSIPYRIEGVWGGRFTGFGLVVDAEQGLVLVDRDTVPIFLGDVELTVGTVKIPGEVLFVHPVHNFAFVHYDPSLLGDTPVESARFSSQSFEDGEPIWLVGIDPDTQPFARETVIARQSSLYLPFPVRRPHFRDVNLDVVEVRDPEESLGGVLCNEDGEVLALWASFHVAESDELDFYDAGALFGGIPSELIEMVLDPLSEGRSPEYRVIGAEFGTVGLADARQLGLSEQRAADFEAALSSRRRMLTVERLWSGFPAEEGLRLGDVLLSVNGELVVDQTQLERSAQADSVELEVLRSGQEVSVSVPTQVLDGRGILRVVSWAGFLLHEPHLEAATQRGIPQSGVYVSWVSYGTPASQSAVRPTMRIDEIDGVPVPDLDTFVEVIATHRDKQAIRLRVLNLDGRASVETLKLDMNYWPSFDLYFQDGEWERHPIGE
ncbi:MAG: PDZ domain-containing protein, partial [Myxococcales bacterium]|nr:PDZ domain-containing protein [Myxococcales bacterium]